VAFGLQAFAITRGVYGERVVWWRPLLMNVLCYQLWVLITPLVLWLSRRFPLDSPTWRRSALVHLPASLVLGCLYLALGQALVFHRFRPESYKPSSLGREYLLSIAANLHVEVLTYAVVVGLAHGARIYRDRRQREVRDAQLLASLSEARLTALKMQLSPHFLFNTLNAVSALVHDDPDAAERMLARLGDLLRDSLRNAGAQEVPLSEELPLLERYLAIEEVRFADRLKVRFEVDPEALGALVPNLLLQPLVENALRHGIARLEGPGEVVIEASRRDRALTLAVRNDGPPLPERVSEGIGLGNTRARLRQLYGEAQRLELRNAPGGVVAEVWLPLRYPRREGAA